jgi:hypothetical protein
MFFRSMRLSCVVCLVSCVLLTGCVPLFVAGAAAGFLVTKDTVAGNFEVSGAKLWDTALAALEEKSKVVEQDQTRGYMKGTINKDEIVIKIKELTESSQNLRVTARKAFAFANLTLAQEVFSKIVRNLERANLK